MTACRMFVGILGACMGVLATHATDWTAWVPQQIKAVEAVSLERNPFRGAETTGSRAETRGLDPVRQELQDRLRAGIRGLSLGQGLDRILFNRRVLAVGQSLVLDTSTGPRALRLRSIEVDRVRFAWDEDGQGERDLCVSLYSGRVLP